MSKQRDVPNTRKIAPPRTWIIQDPVTLRICFIEASGEQAFIAQLASIEAELGRKVIVCGSTDVHSKSELHQRFARYRTHVPKSW